MPSRTTVRSCRSKVGPGLRIALSGNPNSGKTSLFNRLTGAAQKVGNWGGVTVEIKEGIAQHHGERLSIVDLPGTYSLSASSLEEQVARDFIVDQRPDVVVDVVDATNLDRHLYLAVQMMELGIRPILVLNMWDEVEDRGIAIDTVLLSKLLGLTIVTTNARTGQGVDELISVAVEGARAGGGVRRRSPAENAAGLFRGQVARRDRGRDQGPGIRSRTM